MSQEERKNWQNNFNMLYVLMHIFAQQYANSWRRFKQQASSVSLEPGSRRKKSQGNTASDKNSSIDQSRRKMSQSWDVILERGIILDIVLYAIDNRGLRWISANELAGSWKANHGNWCLKLRRKCKIVRNLSSLMRLADENLGQHTQVHSRTCSRASRPLSRPLS